MCVVFVVLLVASLAVVRASLSKKKTTSVFQKKNVPQENVSHFVFFRKIIKNALNYEYYRFN